MSVNRRLSSGLERVNSPATGRNPVLALCSVLTSLLLVTVLAGCGEGISTAAGGAASSTTTPTEPSPATSSSAPEPGEAIPDGSYAKTVTVADAKEMGIADQDFLSELGKDGETTFVFKIADDRFTVFVVEEGVPEPGDVGALAYDGDEDVAMTSESDGCPGCVYTYDWSLVRDELTLELVGHESTDTPEGVVIVRFVSEGVFTRQP